MSAPRRRPSASADAQARAPSADRERLRGADRLPALRPRRDRRAATGPRPSQPPPRQQRSRAGYWLTSRQRAGRRRPAKSRRLRRGLAQAQRTGRRAQAALDLARQDRATAVVVAHRRRGRHRQAEAGDYVQPGSRLMTVVPMRALYVTATSRRPSRAHAPARPRTMKSTP